MCYLVNCNMYYYTVNCNMGSVKSYSLQAARGPRLPDVAAPLRALPGGRRGRAPAAARAEALTDGIGAPDPNPRHLANWCF